MDAKYVSQSKKKLFFFLIIRELLTHLNGFRPRCLVILSKWFFRKVALK